MESANEAKPLAGKTVAILETRREDMLAQMFEAKGAAVEHCPLVVIVDAPESAPVVAWLREFCAGKFDDLILLTGEGLTRLHGFAQREGLAEPFRAELALVRKIVRGPKPARALAALDLKPDVSAAAPTTEGVIEALRKEDLKGRRVAVQLYDVQPNEKLVSFLQGAGAAVSTVAPYRYAPQSDDTRIAGLIGKMAEGKIDIAPFTSAPQVRALKECAARRGLQEDLAAGLQRTLVAAIGPVVLAELERSGFPAHLTLEKNFFMGPLVNALAERAEKTDPGIKTMRIACLQHVPFEDAAAIGDWAARHRHSLKPVHLYRGEPAPAPGDYDLLLMMGGPMNIYEEAEYPWLADEKRAIRAALDANKAMLGVCLGAQLMADVLGGPVTRNPLKEIGWFPVSLRPEAARCPLLAGWPDAFESFHWHGDTFAIPPGAVHLASSAACANQAFSYGDRALGLQFHMEYRADSIREMLRECDAEIEAGGPCVQSAETILAGIPKLGALHPLLEKALDSLAFIAGTSAR